MAIGAAVVRRILWRLVESQRRAAILFVVACGSIGHGQVVRAATYTWTGATDSLWSTATNWNATSPAGGPVSSDSIVFNTAATVDLGNVSRTVANVAASGMTLPLTVAMSSGSLTINGGNQSFGVQANGNLVTDLSGLSSFTYTQTGANNTFDVRMTTPAAGAASGTATLKLAMQGSGMNLIRANAIQIGAAAGSSAGTAWGGVLALGKATTLNTAAFNIGGFNGSGSSSFQAGVSGGTLVLRGTAGGSNRAATMAVGDTSSGARDGSGTLDLTGGTIDALVTTLKIGRHGANANNGPTSVVIMPGGTLDAATFILGEKSDTTGTPTISSTFSQLGGVVATGTIVFGNTINATNAATPVFNSTVNLSGGTFRAAAITSIPTIALTGANTSSASSDRRIAWSGGTIANYDASTDLTISGTSTNAGYAMKLVLGSTTTPQVFSADSGRTITLGSNAVVSGAGLLQKQGDGTLQINTAATYTGNTSIAAGTVRLGVANGLPTSTALALNPSAGTATLDLAGFSQTLGSLSSSGAGSAVVDVASSGTATLTVGGDNTSTTFAGRMRNSGGATSVLGFTKTGTGTLTLTGSNSALAGNLAFNSGKVTIDPGSGGTFTSTGRFQMLPGSGVTATLEILSGSSSFSTSAGIGGLADNAATGTALWNLSGGTTTLALSANRFLIGNKGTGSVTVSNNASFTITGTPDLVVGGDQAFAMNNATGVVTVSGGTLSITGAGNLFLGRNAVSTTTGANGTINLDGGVFATIRPFTMAAGSGTGTINFNGGTLRALGPSADFIAVTAANITDGGAIIDTNSFDVTIGQRLLNGGVGGLTKRGGGTLTLTGSSTYAGPTSVVAGKLAVNGVLGSGTLSVAAAAWLSGTGTIGGPVVVQGSLGPGNSPGLLVVKALELQTTSTTSMEVAGTVRGTGYDAIDINASSGLSYGGILELSFASTFPDNTTFNLFGFTGTPAGTFTGVSANGSYGGLTFVKQAGVWTAQSGIQTISFTESTGNVLIVPEPSAAVLGAVSALGICGWAVRRRVLAGSAIA